MTKLITLAGKSEAELNELVGRTVYAARAMRPKGYTIAKGSRTIIQSVDLIQGGHIVNDKCEDWCAINVAPFPECPYMGLAGTLCDPKDLTLTIR